MKTNVGRFALYAGVSISALGAATIPLSPAVAAPHDTLADGTYPGAFTASDTVEICDLATPPGSPCFFGEIDTGSPVANATMNALGNGQFTQFPGTGNGQLTNSGTAEFGAIASAVNGAGLATANATAISAVWQIGSGTTIDYLVDNDGWLLINAIANASATGLTGDANANANLLGGNGGSLRQAAFASGDVNLSIENSATLEFVASANAVAPSEANANAVVTSALVQEGTGNLVTINLANDGLLNIVANAVASGTDAGNPFNDATAAVTSGIVQNANGSAGASVGLTNAALISIGANASAFNGNANADADVVNAIVQNANAQSGSAVASIDNGGTLAIDAAAYANGGVSIDAQANVTNAIGQYAFVSTGSAAANLVNGGSLAIGAYAQGTGTAGSEAQVTAVANNLIEQDAFTFSGSAANLVDNDGSMTVQVSALASTGSPASRANASINEAIDQTANSWGGGGNASNSILNAGDLGVSAFANAVASSGVASAHANVVSAIGQYASATGTGLASNLVQNDGAMTIGAAAAATGTGYVSATAYNNYAIDQHADGWSDADASNAIDNSGAMSITASAEANGGTSAYAYASNYQAIDQDAHTFGAGNASNSLNNGGSLNISAIANASATAPAVASAYNTSAIAQSASAFGSGNATNSIANSGTLAILASANATDPSSAYAYGYVANGISQNANAYGGGDALNDLANNGAIDISAVANANASTGAATASATVSSAINQYANADNGGDATSLITNSTGALIAIDANAVANGFDFASAAAYVATGIYQSATATGGGAALASLTNAGTIAISANASANAAPLTVITSVGGYSAGTAIANATLDTGVQQYANAVNKSQTATATIGGGTAFTYSGSAVATAALANSGNLDVAADARAVGYNAFAAASISNAGISQDANAQGGSAAFANASLVNDGSIDVGAMATALGTANAAAFAFVDDGIYQDANAFAKEGAAIAEASLDNGGTIDIAADANAVASGADPLSGSAILGNATAVATLSTGIDQNAIASGFRIAGKSALGSTIFAAVTSATASVSLDNSGSIAIGANAGAVGSDAVAVAGIGNGINQVASAGASSFASGSAQINNDGALSVLADAGATATDSATAIAFVGTGVGQTVSVAAKSGTAIADVALTNAGSIDVGANALASGGSFGGAFASVGQGINQFAVANGLAGSANATISNSGEINVGADASATGATAIATASVGTGIGQYAYGVTSASASLDNGGSIAITAEADAGGENSFFALAAANVGVGISQSATASATAGIVNVTLDNSGSILIAADADGALASDGSAVAIGVIGTGIGQYASASSQASVTLANSGTIDMAGVASATADDDATAVAGVGTMVYQSASAWGTSGVASASVINDGSMTGMANAQAIGGDDVFADAFVGGIYQGAFGGTSGSANVSLVNNGPLSISADARAIGGGNGTALAFAEGGTQSALAGDGVTVSLTNTDVITISADADVLVGNAAQKGADAAASAVAFGWIQEANSSRSVTKSGTTAFTTAFPGTAVASSTMTGVGFTRTFTFTNTPTGPALATYNNSGSLSITADASAVGDDTASAFAIAAGTTQFANGTSAVASMVNDGTMEYSANAVASGDNGASALAVGVGFHQFASAAAKSFQQTTVGTGTVHLGTGGTQLVGVATPTSQQRTVTTWNNVFGPALASITNTGSFSVGANATAVAGGNDGPVTGTTAPAVASAFVDAIHQEARGATATAVLDNSGSIDAHVNAQASGAANATANAAVQGVLQVANAVSYSTVLNQHFETVTATTTFGHTFTYQTFVTTGSAMAATPVGPATVLFDNSGSLDVSAVASAVAGGAALASATAVGVNQVASGTSANATVLNTGDIDVLASAFASGTAATANANALGIQQNLFGTAMNASLNNSGSINVGAVASAIMPAFANATGYQVLGTGGGTLSMAVTNSGDLNVSATAVDPLGTAVANAVGMDISNAPTGTATLFGSPITGSLTNSGTVDVFAFASGTASTANATGISIMSGINTMTVTNSGSLLVDAVVANGGNANANGLVVAGNGAVTPLAGDLFIFTNDEGNIVVRESSDGGSTWQRGMALDVSAAPNNSVINLLGDGSIYGNIDVQDGDAIYVENGVTVFDGIINPECMPPVYDVVAKSACGQGSLTIRNNGNLYLVDGNDSAAMDDGPSYVFVDTFNMGATGAIWFELNPTSGGTQPIGTYPQVFADVANLDGTLVADIGLGTLLPANNYFWNNVIDANVRNGTFDACIAMGLPGAGLDSLFLNGTGAGGNLCIYDAQANVDLGIERRAFNAVGGLTDNQLAVANAIEAVYAPSLTGPFANLLVQMFNFEDGDAADYADALDMLSGVEYPNYLHAVRNNTFVLNSFVSDQIDCAIHIRGVEECRSPETRGRLWVKGTYNSAELDSNANYIGYDADSWSAMIGGDVTFSNFRLGAFAGYRDIDVTYPDALTGNGIKADGLQVGAYGAYDVGSFYVRAIGSYSWLGGKSQRSIELFDISTIATGEPDVNVFSLYGEAGARFDLGGSWLTPFVAIDHTSLDIKGFNESNGAGAGLQIDNQTESQTSGLIGLKWAGNWGGIIPEAKVAYRHDFNGDLGVDMRFVDAPAGSDFRKVEEYDDGSLIAGLSLAGSMGSSLVGRIGYQGRFSDEVEDHAIYGALTFLFGAAPPPPPPVAAPPAPPPAPATQTCPDGTVILATEVCPAPPPPPPPPPPMPERG